MEEPISDEDRGHARAMAASYFFAAWGDRMWEFACVVFVMEIFPTSLLPASFFGFAKALTGILSGTPIGKYIDNEDRLKVIRTSIFGQNLTISVASVVFAIALSRDSLSFANRWTVVGIILIAAICARIASAMNKISIHKDWTVVLAGKRKSFQSQLNSTMRRVDLCCQILAPMMVGLLSLFYGPALTCVVIAGWAAVSIFVEYRLSGYVYGQVHALSVKKAIISLEEGSQSDKSSKPSWFEEQRSNLQAYWDHRAYAVSIPYCFLYMSILSFHGTMVSYCRTIGVSDLWLAVGRAVAAVLSILSTYVVPAMRKRHGLNVTGMFMIWSQILCLTPLAMAFIFYAPEFEDQRALPFIVIVFVTLCTSRFGLWGFDLAQTQLMQELVEHERAGAINGAQETVVNFCWLISFTFTMVFHDPRDFIYPASMSYSALLAAGLLFSRYFIDVKEESGEASLGIDSSTGQAPASVCEASASEDNEV